MLTKMKPLMDSGWRNILRRVPTSSVLYLPGLDYGNWHTGTIKDFSGSANDGAIIGATKNRLPSGLWYLNFDGDDRVVIVDSASLRPETSDFTIKAWVNVTNVDTNRYVADKYVHADGGWSTWVTTERNMFFRYKAGGVAYDLDSSAAPLVPLGTPTHLVWVRNYTNLTMNFLINGVPGTSRAMVDCTLNGTTELRLGNSSYWTTAWFLGQMALLEMIKGIGWSTAQALASYQKERRFFGV